MKSVFGALHGNSYAEDSIGSSTKNQRPSEVQSLSYGEKVQRRIYGKNLAYYLKKIIERYLKLAGMSNLVLKRISNKQFLIKKTKNQELSISDLKRVTAAINRDLLIPKQLGSLRVEQGITGLRIVVQPDFHYMGKSRVHAGFSLGLLHKPQYHEGKYNAYEVSKDDLFAIGKISDFIQKLNQRIEYPTLLSNRLESDNAFSATIFTHRNPDLLRALVNLREDMRGIARLQYEFKKPKNAYMESFFKISLIPMFDSHKYLIAKEKYLSPKKIESLEKQYSLKLAA